jgi:hypothetical protein
MNLEAKKFTDWFVAVKSAPIEKMQTLLRNGADANARGNRSRILLQFAVRENPWWRELVFLTASI